MLKQICNWSQFLLYLLPDSRFDFSRQLRNIRRGSFSCLPDEDVEFERQTSFQLFDVGARELPLPDGGGARAIPARHTPRPLP